ncbi:hypothetical protein [Hoeflea sp. IMCC20628]|uniref:hypothetical protein n=1 Tax=Hoeflea sp. IMCC20628 TaxID=1620421 RepID=UPI0012E0BEE1|nr:hypothetical protein [Hoeflea sp. IMCC20628]
MSMDSRLKRGEDDCKTAASRLPNSAREPDADDIRGMILECGFRAGEASGNADCGGTPTAGRNQNTRGPKRPGAAGGADDVTLAPRIIQLGKWVEGIVHDGSNLWVSESGQRTIARVDYRTGKLLERLKVGRLPIAITSIGKDVFTLVATDKVILKHDERSKKTRLANLKDCPTAMLASGEDLFVLGEPNCSSNESRLTRIDARTGKQKASSNLGEWGQAITAFGSEIWVGHARGSTVSVVRTSDMKVSKVKLPGIEVWAMASNSKSVFAGGSTANSNADGSIVMIDAQTRKEVRRFSPAERVAEIAADDTKVVAVGDEGTIWVLSPRDLSLLRTIHANSGDYEPKAIAFVKDELVVSVGQYIGEKGAVFVFADYLPHGLSVAAGPTRPSSRPQRPSSTNNGKPGNISRPGRPSSTNTGRPPQVIQRPNRPQRPGSSKGFPLSARSFQGNVRSKPTINSAIVAKTSNMQPVKLLARTGVMLANYPWFSIEFANGRKGYQWGKLICSKTKPIAGTRGACPSDRPTKPRFNPQVSGNQGSGIKNGQSNGADVVVGILNLFGQIIDSNNNKNNSSNGQNLFSENIQVRPGDGPVSFFRDLNDGQLAIYTLRGKRGQRLRVESWSQSKNAIFNIYVNKAVEGGRTLPGANDGDYATYFDGELPENGNYLIAIGSTGGQTSYELVVTVDEEENKYKPSYAAGASNSKLVVGTYSGANVESGNIQYNEKTRSLTWTEFCGPTISLNPDWVNSRLIPRVGGLKAFRLNVKDGEVLGFRSRQNTYVKQAGIMMPMCVAPPKNPRGGKNKGPGSAAPDWALDPQDARRSKDYSSLPNTYWRICEAANSNPKSKDFNNERAFWDCADEGLKLTAGTGGNSGKNPAALPDKRTNKDYRLVPSAEQQICGTKYPGSPKDDKGYFDCMDVFLAAAKTAGNGNTPAAPDWTLKPQDRIRSVKDYSSVPTREWSKCESANNDPKSPKFNNEKAFWDCADQGLLSVGGAPVAPVPTAPAVPDPRSSKDYSAVPAVEEQKCSNAYPVSPKDDKGYYDCQDAALAAVGHTAPVTPDPRLNKDYSAVPTAEDQKCAVAFPDSPKDDKGYYDCKDAALAVILSMPPVAPTAPTASDPRSSKDYTLVPSAPQQSCQTKFPDSPKDDKGYYDCMDAALTAVGTGTPATPVAPGTPVAPDPRSSKDYTLVPTAPQQSCQTSFPDSPKDDKGYYDCMDAALTAVGTGTPATPVAPGTPVAPDPRSSKDYTLVPSAPQQSCQTSFPDSPKDDKDYYDCMDAALTAVGTGTPATPAAPGTPVAPGTPAAPDPRSSKDYTLVPTAPQQSCQTSFPDSPKDDKGYYDCMDAALTAVGTGTPATPVAPGTPAAPDPRGSKDYSLVPTAPQQSCQTNFPDSPKDDKGYYDCMDAALTAVGSGTPVAPGTPAAPDPRGSKDYSLVPTAPQQSCQTNFPDSPKDDKGYYDCMDAALTAVGSGTPATPVAPGTPAAPDSRSSKDYSLVPTAPQQSCQTSFPDSPKDDKGYYDCMDTALTAVGTGTPATPVAPGTPGAPDPRGANDYSAVPPAEEQKCSSAFPNSPQDDKGYYDCQDAALKAVGTAPVAPVAPDPSAGTPAAPDPRGANDYSAVPPAEEQKCSSAFPNSPQDDKGYYNCQDAALKAVGTAPVTPVAPDPSAGTPAAPDPRGSNDYSAVPPAEEQKCSSAFPNSPQDDKGYYDCQDAALKAVGNAPVAPVAPDPSAGTPAAPDPRGSNDYSAVPPAEEQKCSSAFPNSPQDDKGYYDCQDAALKAVGNAPVAPVAPDPSAGTPAAPDPRGANDYSAVPPAEEQKCSAAFPNSPQDDKGYYDCQDAALKAVGNAPVAPVAPDPSAGTPAAPDPRGANDYSAVPPAEEQKCSAAFPNSPQDDKGYYDCQDAALKAVGNAPVAPVAPDPSAGTPAAPDPRGANDYSAVPPAEEQKCSAAFPNSPQDDKGYYDCQDAALKVVGNAPVAPAAPDSDSGAADKSSGAADDQDAALNEIYGYCSSTFPGSEDPCYQALAQCLSVSSDTDSNEYFQCAQEAGWVQ